MKSAHKNDYRTASLTMSQIRNKIIAISFSLFLFAALLLSANLFPSEKSYTNIGELTQKINDLKKRQKDERELFNKYKREMESFIKQKQNEKNGLEKKVMQLSKNILAEKNKMVVVNNSKRNIERKFKDYTKVIANEIKKYKQNIQTGIPFEQVKRLSALSSLEIDIEGLRGSSEEYFSRLTDFLESEERMAYNSEVINTLYSFKKGSKTEVQLLRIGRVFFALQHNDDVFLFNKIQNKWGLSKNFKLSLTQKKNIKNSIKILKGNKPPALIQLPVPTSLIEVKGANNVGK